MADVERNRRKAVFDTHPSLTAFFLPEEKDAHLHFFLSDPREIIQDPRYLDQFFENVRTSKATLRVYDTHGRTPLELAIYSFYVDFLDKAANCYNRMSEPTTQHFLGFCPEDVLWLTEFFIPLRKHKEKRGDPKTFIPKSQRETQFLTREIQDLFVKFYFNTDTEASRKTPRANLLLNERAGPPPLSDMGLFQNYLGDGPITQCMVENSSPNNYNIPDKDRMLAYRHMCQAAAMRSWRPFAFIAKSYLEKKIRDKTEKYGDQLTPQDIALVPGLDIYQIPIGEEGPRCSLVDILEGFAGEVIPTLFLAALKINKFIKMAIVFLKHGDMTSVVNELAATQISMMYKCAMTMSSEDPIRKFIMERMVETGVTTKKISFPKTVSQTEFEAYLALFKPLHQEIKAKETANRLLAHFAKGERKTFFYNLRTDIEELFDPNAVVGKSHTPVFSSDRWTDNVLNQDMFPTMLTLMVKGTMLPFKQDKTRKYYHGVIDLLPLFAQLNENGDPLMHFLVKRGSPVDKGVLIDIVNLLSFISKKDHNSSTPQADITQTMSLLKLRNGDGEALLYTLIRSDQWTDNEIESFFEELANFSSDDDIREVIKQKITLLDSRCILDLGDSVVSAERKRKIANKIKKWGSTVQWKDLLGAPNKRVSDLADDYKGLTLSQLDRRLGPLEEIPLKDRKTGNEGVISTTKRIQSLHVIKAHEKFRNEVKRINTIILDEISAPTTLTKAAAVVATNVTNALGSLKRQFFGSSAPPPPKRQRIETKMYTVQEAIRNLKERARGVEGFNVTRDNVDFNAYI